MSPNSSLSRLSKRRVCLGITPCLVSHQFLSALCFYFQIQSSVAWLLSACSYCSHRLWSTELSKWMRSAQDMLWKHWVCRLGKSNPVPGRENTLGQTETVGWSRRLKLLECRNTRVGWQNLMLRQSLSSLLCRVERGTGTCLAGELGISHLFPALVAALEVLHIYPCRNSPFVSASSSYPWSFAQIQVWLHFPFIPIMICHFLLCGVFSLKHNPGTITLQYVGIIIHSFQFTTRKRLGCHACPVSPHSPMSQLPFESS